MRKYSGSPVRLAGTAVAIIFGAGLVAGASPNAGLTVYDGKFATEVVGGSSFLDNPEVVRVVNAAVEDKEALATVLSPAQTTSAPIFRDATGITYVACQRNNCAGRNWSIRLNLGNRGGSVCYYDANALPGYAWVMTRDGHKTKVAGNCHAGVPTPTRMLRRR